MVLKQESLGIAAIKGTSRPVDEIKSPVVESITYRFK